MKEMADVRYELNCLRESTEAQREDKEMITRMNERQRKSERTKHDILKRWNR